jgi:predicted DNA-binding ribbon-helix-helix protein
LILGGHKTSVSLEDAFWSALKEIAHKQRLSAGQLAARIDGSREHHNLSSAIRLFVLNYYRSQAATQDRHGADHGLTRPPPESGRREGLGPAAGITPGRAR